jgi:hypothetical protein
VVLERNFGLIAVAAALGVYTLVVGYEMPSIIFVTAFSWGFVAFAALFGRIEAAKTMAITMLGLLTLSAITLIASPLGRDDMTALLSLALFPSVVAWACVYVYIRHLQRLTMAPDVSFDRLFSDAIGQSSEEEVRARAMQSESFTRAMMEGAVQPAFARRAAS